MRGKVINRWSRLAIGAAAGLLVVGLVSLISPMTTDVLGQSGRPDGPNDPQTFRPGDARRLGNDTVVNESAWSVAVDRQGNRITFNAGNQPIQVVANPPDRATCSTAADGTVSCTTRGNVTLTIRSAGEPASATFAGVQDPATVPAPARLEPQSSDQTRRNDLLAGVGAAALGVAGTALVLRRRRASDSNRG